MKALSKNAFVLTIFMLVTLLVGCSSSKKEVKLDDIEYVVLWEQTNNEDYMLNEEDLKEFIKLYNSAAYSGEGTGEGGTAEFGAVIEFKDGSFMRINEFCGSQRTFEITTHKENSERTEWFYAENEKLEKFIVEKLQQFEEQTGNENNNE